MTITRLGQLTAELQTTLGVTLTTGSTYPTISSTKAKTGTYSFRNTSNGAPFGLSFGAVAAVRCAFFANHNSSLSATPQIVTLRVGESIVRVRWNVASNQFELILGYGYNSGFLNVAATADAGAFQATNTWRLLGIAYCCHASAGYISFYVDGVQVLTVTGDTTVYASQATAKEPASITGAFVLGLVGTSSWTNYAYVDDFYVDSCVGEADAPPPGRRFLFSLADGAGAAAGWTPLSGTNISNVDENPNDEDATYVKALSADLVDSYETADVTLPADHGIAAVIPVAVARKTEAGVASSLKLLAYDGANTALGAEQQLSTSYGLVWERMATQPDGSSWGSTPDDFNAAEFGVKSAGTF